MTGNTSINTHTMLATSYSQEWVAGIIKSWSVDINTMWLYAVAMTKFHGVSMWYGDVRLASTVV